MTDEAVKHDADCALHDGGECDCDVYLNAVCDARRDMPTVAVTLDDL